MAVRSSAISCLQLVQHVAYRLTCTSKPDPDWLRTALKVPVEMDLPIPTETFHSYHNYQALLGASIGASIYALGAAIFSWSSADREEPMGIHYAKMVALALATIILYNKHSSSVKNENKLHETTLETISSVNKLKQCAKGLDCLADIADLLDDEKRKTAYLYFATFLPCSSLENNSVEALIQNYATAALFHTEDSLNSFAPEWGISKEMDTQDSTDEDDDSTVSSDSSTEESNGSLCGYDPRDLSSLYTEYTDGNLMTGSLADIFSERDNIYITKQPYF